MKLKFYIPLLLGLLCFTNAKAQYVAVKTNLLYDAAATVNLGVEVGIAPKWTLDISGNLNAWNIDEDAIQLHYIKDGKVYEANYPSLKVLYDDVVTNGNAIILRE